MLLWLIACSTPERPSPPAPETPAPVDGCTGVGSPRSVVVETSVLPRGEGPQRRRAELVRAASDCTGEHCRLVDEARMDEVVRLGLEAVAMTTTPQHASPHMPSRTVRVVWPDTSCERRSTRLFHVSDPERFAEIVGELQHLWRQSADPQ